MSCIRFNTEAQRQQFRFADCEAVSVSAFTSTEITQTKIDRVVAMSKSGNHKIREAAAASHIAPEHVYFALSRDEIATVRTWVARNDYAPSAVLQDLSEDVDETVRSFVAINRFTPKDAILKLLEDQSEQVRNLARWTQAQAT